MHKLKLNIIIIILTVYNRYSEFSTCIYSIYILLFPVSNNNQYVVTSFLLLRLSVNYNSSGIYIKFSSRLSVYGYYSVVNNMWPRTVIK